VVPGSSVEGGLCVVYLWIMGRFEGLGRPVGGSVTLVPVAGVVVEYLWNIGLLVGLGLP
jgi:hypothetical protein